jgi:hypothetical protein
MGKEKDVGLGRGLAWGIPTVQAIKDVVIVP